MSLKAILFDVDGTLAETEEAHRRAFNQSFAEADRAWCWSVDDYRELLKVAGGRERIRHFADTIGEAASDEQIAEIHIRKNALYADIVAAGGSPARPGIKRLIGEARNAGLRIAIATTTSRPNLEALVEKLFGIGSMAWFDAAVTGEDVEAKKPDPEVYTLTLEALGLDAAECIAIEDSRNGVLAAAACGIPILATPSLYTSGDDFSGATAIRASLDDPAPIGIEDLDRIIAQARQFAVAP